LDVSETLDGAGGVGGLLWVRLTGGAAAGVHFVTYDGNGNVWNLVSASTGTETARYEYGPFGEPLRLTGAAAGSNPFRFSTKRTEDGTGLVLYEYRAYSPALGRWLSRDPAVEGEGLNIYGMVSNDALNRVDYLGLLELYFRIITGHPVLFSDKYTNPPGYGEGEEDTDGRTYAKSRIRVYSGNPKSNGTCNSIVVLTDFPEFSRCNAGTVGVHFKPHCPGKYSVYFDVELKISASGPVGRSSATLIGGGRYFFHDHVFTPQPPKIVRKRIRVDVVAAKDKILILKWDPLIAMPPRAPERDSYGEAYVVIRYRATKKDGKIIDGNP
jgi:RHS repeat-associated protein